MYPLCFPRGPFTVPEGTTQYAICISETGNPQVQLQIQGDTVGEWMYSAGDNLIQRFVKVTIGAADDGSSYNCSIASNSKIFVGMERSCIIGPITVVAVTTKLTEYDQTLTTTLQPTTGDPHGMLTDDTSVIPTTDPCRSFPDETPTIAAQASSIRGSLSPLSASSS